MKIVVVGCGRVGADLAYRLYLNGHHIIVVDKSESAFQNLPEDFKGRLVEGQVLGRDVLRRAGVEDADGLAAVTNSDTMNAVIAHIAREEFHIPNIVARNYNSHWRNTLEVFGLQLVSASSWGAQRIEELLYSQETRTVYSSGNGEVELYEFTVREDWNGRPIGDLIPETECVIASLSRAGRAIIPSRSMLLNTGDVIVISATLDGSQEIHRRLSNRSNGGKEE